MLAFRAGTGRDPNRLDIAAMKGRLYEWPLQRLRWVAASCFWIGLLGGVTFTILVAVRERPLFNGDVKTRPKLGGLLVSGLLLGIGLVLSRPYAARGGTIFGVGPPGDGLEI
jgi:hypothetical protein